MFRLVYYRAAVLLFLVIPCLAQQASSKKIVGTEWNASVSGDVLNIDIKTSSTSPQQIFNPSPSFLQVSFPQTKLIGSAQTATVDKGLVQKVQISQDAGSTFARIYVVNKPKVALTKTAQGYRYSIMLNEPAQAPSRPIEAAAPKKSEQPKSSVQESKIQAQSPSKESAKVNTAPTITAPVAPKPPNASLDKKPLNASLDKSSLSAGPLVTVLFKNKPLNEALEEIAQKAGYQAQIASDINGVVNLSLSEVPLKDALSMLLEPYGSSIVLNVSDKNISVSRAANSAGATPATAPVSSSPIVYEYFPLQSKSAEKMMEALQKAVPDVSYRVDPVLNILLVAGQKQDIIKVSEFLKTLFKK